MLIALVTLCCAGFFCYLGYIAYSFIRLLRFDKIKSSLREIEDKRNYLEILVYLLSVAVPFLLGNAVIFVSQGLFVGTFGWLGYGIIMLTPWLYILSWLCLIFFYRSHKKLVLRYITEWAIGGGLAIYFAVSPTMLDGSFIGTLWKLLAYPLRMGESHIFSHPVSYLCIAVAMVGFCGFCQWQNRANAGTK